MNVTIQAPEPRRQGTLPAKNGHSVFWAEYGPEDGMPLLLVHGGFGHVFDMANMAGVTAARDRRIIILHQRGVGQSTPQGRIKGNTIDGNIGDIERLRTHLGIQEWDMLAWSFGAVLAAGYALRHPSCVKSLTAYAPYFGSDEDYRVIQRKTPELAKKYTDFHGASDGRGIVASIFNKASHPDAAIRFRAHVEAMRLWDEQATEDTIRRSMTPSECKALLETRRIGAMLDHELFNRHDRLLEKLARKADKVPASHLLYGAHDNWSAPHEYARAIFNRAAVLTIQNAGHDIHTPQVQKALARIYAPF
jgi:proline iminopeptidase